MIRALSIFLVLLHFVLASFIHAEEPWREELERLNAKTASGLNGYEWSRLDELRLIKAKAERKQELKNLQENTTTVEGLGNLLHKLSTNYLQYGDLNRVDIVLSLQKTPYYQNLDSSPEKVQEFLNYIKKCSYHLTTRYLLKDTKSVWLQETLKTIDLDVSRHWNLTELYFPLLETFNLLRLVKKSPTEDNRQKLKSSYYTLLSRIGADADWYEANGVHKENKISLEQFFSSTKLPVAFATLVRNLEEKDKELLRNLTKEIEEEGGHKRSFGRKEVLKDVGFTLGIFSTLGGLGFAAGSAVDFFIHNEDHVMQLLSTAAALTSGLLPEFGFLGDRRPFGRYKYALRTGENMGIQTDYYSYSVYPRELQRKEYRLIQKILTGEGFSDAIPIREDSDRKNICINALVDLSR